MGTLAARTGGPMARMYPQRLLEPPTSGAERDLFGLFESRLPASYTVFYSVSWLARRGGSGARDGEADFLIVHPDHGILVLEVKGGQIAYDGALDRWTSRDR